jgi:hypothetical protein
MKLKKFINGRKLRRRARKTKHPGEVVHATYDDGAHADITAYVSSYIENATEPNCYHLRVFLADFMLLSPEYKIHIYYYDLDKIKYVCIDLENQAEITTFGVVNDGMINLRANSQIDTSVTQIE